jgi:hypothetical protein
MTFSAVMEAKKLWEAAQTSFEMMSTIELKIPAIGARRWCFGRRPLSYRRVRPRKLRRSAAGALSSHTMQIDRVLWAGINHVCFEGTEYPARNVPQEDLSITEATYTKFNNWVLEETVRSIIEA